MKTLLLIAVALAIPIVLILPALGVDRAADPEVRGSRLIRKIGFVLGLLLSATFVLFGILGFIDAVGASHVDWLGMPISLLVLALGTEVGVTLLLRDRVPASKKRSIRFFILATGFFLIAGCFLAASFVESWWYLLAAGLTGWLAAVHLYVARTAETWD